MIRDVRVIQEKDAKGVYIRVTPGYPLNDEKVDFYRTSASTLEARLLSNEIASQLQDMFERIRRHAYKQGWKDKASKQVKKCEWFSSYAGLTDKEKA